jgi:alkyl hydroperoxide reductase subunit AhpC
MELRSLRDAAQALEKLDAVILAVSFRPSDFNKSLCEKESLSFQLLSDPDRAVIKRYGVFNEQDNCAQRVTFLVDKEGVLRYADRKVNPAAHGKDLAQLVKDLQRGKTLYTTHCARCHGADGGETQNYPNIKSLKGMGNKHDEQDIIKLTRLAAFVDINAWSEEERQAMAKFIRGL